MSQIAVGRRGGWPDLVNVTIGCWLYLSPFFLLHYEEMISSLNAYICGGTIAVFAAQAKGEYRLVARALTGLVAIWLIISPWLLGFAALTTVGTMSAVITGLIVLSLAGWSATHDHAPDAPQPV